MSNLNTIQLVVGVFSCLFLAVPGAFVLYWNLVAKKHLVVPQQKLRKIEQAEIPVFELGGASFQNN
jgi:hypothetical protein